MLTMEKSKAWADAIVPQPECGFLKLPLEVRVSIYKLVIDDFTIDQMDGEFFPIEPRKKGNKFSSYNWSEPGKGKVLSLSKSNTD